MAAAATAAAGPCSAADSIARVLTAAHAFDALGLPAEAAEAISAGADVLLLDNMDDDTMADIIRTHAGECLFEASGNLTAARLKRFPEIGVNVASMGGLIHQATWADLSMKFDRGAAG